MTIAFTVGIAGGRIPMLSWVSLGPRGFTDQCCVLGMQFDLVERQVELQAYLLV